MTDDPGKLILDRARDDQKPKITRGIMATLPAHAQDEMREANRELGMALEVVRGIVDAHVAGALPPGKVTELVVKRRREDDEEALARRRVMPGGFTQEQARMMAAQDAEAVREEPAAQIVDLMGALKESLKAREGA